MIISAGCSPTPEQQVREAVEDAAKLEQLLGQNIFSSEEKKKALAEGLEKAVSNQLFTATKILLQHGAEPLDASGSYGNALSAALCGESSALFELLLANTKKYDPAVGKNLAESAFECKKESRIFKLPDGKKLHANALLKTACHVPKVHQRAREAIQLGADVNQLDEWRETPFYQSLCHEDEKLLAYAAKQGLNFSHKSAKDQTIFEAVTARGNLRGIRSLVMAGAPISLTAVVIKTSERIVTENKTETILLPGNRKATKTVQRDKKIVDELRTPLLDYVREKDPALYQLMQTRITRGQVVAPDQK